MLRVLSEMPPLLISSFLPSVLMAITERMWGKRSLKIGCMEDSCLQAPMAIVSISRCVFNRWLCIWIRNRMFTCYESIFQNEFVQWYILYISGILDRNRNYIRTIRIIRNSQDTKQSTKTQEQYVHEWAASLLSWVSRKLDPVGFSFWVHWW